MEEYEQQGWAEYDEHANGRDRKKNHVLSPHAGAEDTHEIHEVSFELVFLVGISSRHGSTSGAERPTGPVQHFVWLLITDARFEQTSEGSMDGIVYEKPFGQQNDEVVVQLDDLG